MYLHIFTSHIILHNIVNYLLLVSDNNYNITDLTIMIFPLFCSK